MALKQIMEMQLVDKIDREQLREFLEHTPPEADIGVHVAHIRGDRNMSDTFKVKLRAEWQVGK